MIDVEDLVRERYLDTLQARRVVADDARVANLLRSAGARRKARMVRGSAAVGAVVAGLAIAGGQFADGSHTPATPPTPAPTAASSPIVNYMATMSGITPVERESLGTPTASGIAGVPDLYPLTPGVLAQASAGWGYTVLGGRDCETQANTDFGVLALVSPDGKAFRAGTIPAGACNVIPVEQSGNLVLLSTGDSDTKQPIYLANVLTGEVDPVTSGAPEALVPEAIFADGRGIVVFSRGGEKPVVVAIDSDGALREIDLSFPYISEVYFWGASAGRLLFATHGDGDVPMWGWHWYTLSPTDEEPAPVNLVVPAGLNPPDDCDAYTSDPATGPIFGCGFDDAGSPTTFYVVHQDGTVEETDRPNSASQGLTVNYQQITDGEIGALDARVAYDWGIGPVIALDSSVLDPESDGVWQQYADVRADAERIAQSTVGLSVAVAQPNGTRRNVIALAQPDGTLLIPDPAGDSPGSFGRWLWWANG